MKTILIILFVFLFACAPKETPKEDLPKHTQYKDSEIDQKCNIEDNVDIRNSKLRTYADHNCGVRGDSTIIDSDLHFIFIGRENLIENSTLNNVSTDTNVKIKNSSITHPSGAGSNVIGENSEITNSTLTSEHTGIAVGKNVILNKVTVYAGLDYYVGKIPDGVKLTNVDIYGAKFELGVTELSNLTCDGGKIPKNCKPK